MHDRHPGGAAVPSGHDALRDRVVDLHRADTVQLAPDSPVEDRSDLVEHHREWGRSGRPATERLQAGPLGPDPGHVEHPVAVLRGPVVRLDEIDECSRPTLAGVVDLVGTGPVTDVLLGQETGIPHLLVVGVRRVAHDVDLVAVTPAPSPDLRVLLQVPVRVVRADTTTLHEPHEREVEMVGDLLVPPANVAVEEVLPTRDAGRPQVTTSREDLEVPDHLDQLVTFARQVVPGIDQAKVPVHNPFHGLRPSLPATVRLRPAVRPVVDDLPGRTPLDLGHAFSLLLIVKFPPQNSSRSSSDQFEITGCGSSGCKPGNTQDWYIFALGAFENPELNTESISESPSRVSLPCRCRPSPSITRHRPSAPGRRLHCSTRPSGSPARRRGSRSGCAESCSCTGSATRSPD